MKLDLDTDICNRAKNPHNLFMLNLALFHLLMTPATIALNLGEAGMLIPLVLSLLVISFTWWRSRQSDRFAHWFIQAHWQLAMKRYRLLLISYAVTAVLLLLSWLISLSVSDAHMGNILQTVFIRIAIMPILVIVMINFFLESSAIGQASSGEIPDKIAQNFTSPPAQQAGA